MTTNRQKIEIVRLRRLHKSHKEIAAIVGVSPDAVQYWLKQAGVPSFHAASHRALTGPDPYRVSPTRYEAQYQAARDALRVEVEAARAERATAPLFRIRPGEWA